MKDSEEQKRSSVTQYSSLRLFPKGSQEYESLNRSRSADRRMGEPAYLLHNQSTGAMCEEYYRSFIKGSTQALIL